VPSVPFRIRPYCSIRTIPPNQRSIIQPFRTNGNEHGLRSSLTLVRASPCPSSPALSDALPDRACAAVCGRAFDVLWSYETVSTSAAFQQSELRWLYAVSTRSRSVPLVLVNPFIPLTIPLPRGSARDHAARAASEVSFHQQWIASSTPQAPAGTPCYVSYPQSPAPPSRGLGFHSFPCSRAKQGTPSPLARWPPAALVDSSIHRC
jgi:hypothetical protein